MRGTEFDQSTTDFGGPVAVDPTGEHVYVADAPDFDTPGGAPYRIFEFNVPSLSPADEFALHGIAASANDTVDAIAVGGPDGDIYVEIDPARGRLGLVQIYQPDGTFIRQVAAPQDAGLAVNPAGEFFTGASSLGFDVHRPDGSSAEPGPTTARPVTVEAVNSSDDLFALEAGKAGQSIAEFAPQIPRTRLIGGPPSGLVLLLHSPTATFRFNSPTTGATFECRLDRRGFDLVPYSPCVSPQTYASTPNGSYTFEVRAVSLDGAPDPTPAKAKFKVVVKYAHAVITSHPAALIGQRSATFEFNSTTPGATFKCRLTGFLRRPRAFQPCSSPATYNHLKHDIYSFQVEAITSRGFVQPGATGYTFAVDPVPPAVSAPVAGISVGEQIGLTGDTTLAVSWSATDPNTPAGELLDSLQERSGPSVTTFGAWSTVAGEDRVPGQTAISVAIAPGAADHEFRALAENKLGIVGTSPAGRAFGLSLIDNGDPAVSYSSGWSSIADSHAVGGTVEEANTAGARATLKFTGTSIGVIGVPAPGHGEITVCIDRGKSSQHCSNVDTNASFKEQRDLIYARNGLTDTQHTIEITSKSTPVVIDGFVVIR